jgi:excisionase family DNA binding protein
MIYTMAEVATRLKVAERTIKRHVQSGHLQSFKVGRARRITEDQLNDFIRRGRGI